MRHALRHVLHHVHRRALGLVALALAAPLGCASTPSGGGGRVASAHAPGDVDGDGAADAVVWDEASRSVRVGALAFTVPDDSDVVGAERVDVGGETIVALVHEVVEDDLTWTVLAYRDGRLVALGDVFLGGAPELPGDGTLRATFGNCGQTTVAVYRIARAAIEKRETTSGTYDVGACAACPLVFRQVDGAWSARGEILRNVVGAAAEASDGLALEVVPGERVVRIELAEVKAETTYLESLALEVAGDDGAVVVVAPRECAGGGAACADDGARDAFRLGERRRFTFDLPTPTPRALRLVARGYYLPFALR